MSADVREQVIKEEPLEHEALCIVNPVMERQEATHLTHQGGWVLISSQGEGHESLIALELVWGVELGEAFLQGLIRVFLRKELNEVDYLG